MLDRRRVQVAHARVPADVCVAGDGRRAALHGGQQRHRRRVRSEDRRAGCGTKTLGTLQKGSPVLADGKLYVGTENGKFYILRPSRDRRRGARRGSARHGGKRRSRSSRRRRRRRPRLRRRRWTPLYAIGKRRAAHRCAIGRARGGRRGSPAAQAASPAPWRRCRCFRTKSLLAPGRRQAFTLRLFDAKGNFIRDEPAAPRSGRSIS